MRRGRTKGRLATITALGGVVRIAGDDAAREVWHGGREEAAVVCGVP